MAFKRLKLVAAGAAVFLTVTALAACGRGGTSSPESTGPGGEETGGSDGGIVIGFSQATMNHPWRVAMADGNLDYAEANFPDVTVKLLDAQDDAATQVSNMESLIAQKVDAIILSPVTADALTPVTKQAMDAGIPVITVDRAVNTEVTQHIGADNRLISAQAGEYLAEVLDGKGNILEIQGTAGASVTNDRNGGFVEAIAKYPDMKIVASTDADYQRNNAASFIENNLQRFRNGEIDAIYAHNDEMALGAQLALEQADLADGIAIVSIDGQNDTIQAIADGKITATFTYPTGAPDAVISAIAAARGETLEKTLVLDSQRIDKSNATEFIGKGI